MKCLSCRINKAIIDPVFGVLPCASCMQRQEHLKKPGNELPEFSGDDIKEGRKSQANDIEPPHYKGQLNKRWLDLYGKDAAKRHGFSDREIRNARYVMNGSPDKYYNEGN